MFLLFEFRMWIVLLAIDRTIDRTSSIRISQNKNLNFDSQSERLKNCCCCCLLLCECRNKIKKTFQTSQSMAFAIPKKCLQLIQFYCCAETKRKREITTIARTHFVRWQWIRYSLVLISSMIVAFSIFCDVHRSNIRLLNCKSNEVKPTNNGLPMN